MRVRSIILNQFFKLVSLFLCIGQIGFAVILILFFYYFAIILILGAQINAHFFEKYPPLENGLGTYLSQIHKEHHDDITRESLDHHNDKKQLATTTGGNQDHRNGWIYKCWPWKKRNSIEPHSEINNNI